MFGTVGEIALITFVMPIGMLRADSAGCGEISSLLIHVRSSCHRFFTFVFVAFGLLGHLGRCRCISLAP
ncbi:hypothetical protein AciX8_1760 [Granulicella mallensis MP5ACTX8]|uniref:Uncharacterized protein n=1 Tax=Granulicella mallensis (strain ATCC BAA-1857 / DSM 23137 / MP5ACTX8) TaxID=682795 RepID=G8NQF0_GRAMM|nr:hypothetical protein AciX8_1760 [Granulicella mallensis MP5ACTX8]